MLKQRLLLGILMTLFFVAVNLIDGRLDGSISESIANTRVQGTILSILIVLLIIPAQIELANLCSRKNFRIFLPVVILGAALLSTVWYWQQFSTGRYAFVSYYLFFVPAGVVLGIFLYQALRYGVEEVIGNCGANILAVFYLGFLSGFVVALRVDFGVWALLMFVFTVKSADIGAYAIGSLFGKHKFSPVISPGKTWEGMVGAVFVSALVGSLFAAGCDIMKWYFGAVFGIIFAYIGQLGDLAESMLKRDTRQKDSSNTVPGFGGLLDVIDSPLVAAPFAYLFFMLAEFIGK